MASNGVTLVSANVCPYAQRARLAAEELRLDFELKEANLTPGHKQQWFTDTYKQALGANEGSDGKVPILLDGDFVLTESLPIVNYLLAKFGGAGSKLPDFNAAPNPREQAHISIYIDQIVNAKLAKHYYEVLMSKDAEATQTASKALLGALAAASKAYEVHGGPYFLGSSVSVADLVTWPILARLTVVEHFHGFKIPAEPAYAALLRFRDSFGLRESAKKTTPDAAFLIAAYEAHVKK